MLINTVLVFLNNALPAFFFISVTSSLIRPYSIPMAWQSSSVFVGLLSAFLLSQSMSSIMNLFEGVGFEILTAFIYLVIYCILLFQLYLNLITTGETDSSRVYFPFSVAIGLILLLNGADLLVYLNGFWSSVESTNSMIIGGIIGFGISLSSALLLLYILRSKLLLKYLKLPYIAFVFISARVFSLIFLKLTAADWLSSHEPLWDSSTIISNTSVIGRFLNALVGYEVRPSLTQTLFYAVGIMIPTLLIYFSKNSIHPMNKDYL